jgi:hypothetical protein
MLAVHLQLSLEPEGESSMASIPAWVLLFLERKEEQQEIQAQQVSA